MDDHVLVLGEALVDVVRHEDGRRTEHPGGSAANVAVALARLGRRVRLASGWADDEHGALLSDHLGADGVELATDPLVLPRTSTAQASIAADGAASYVFDLEWRLGPILPGPDPLVVHTCSLGAVLEPGAEAVLTVLRRLRTTATISYDVNLRPAITGTGPDLRARVLRVVAAADVVKASDEDLAGLCPGVDPLATAHELLAAGPRVVVVTRGGDGAVWLDASGEVDVASAPVRVADTIGAGDTFGAALIDALWERGRLGASGRERLGALPREEVHEVLAHAARAAAVTVSRPGADPPYAAEL